VPAAAVIPAPIAYIKVVAVKTLVVEILLVKTGRALHMYLFSLASVRSIQRVTPLDIRNRYFEKIRVFQAGVMP
jgi:hypothetical protein